jgi:hypothetical protein
MRNKKALFPLLAVICLLSASSCNDRTTTLRMLLFLLHRMHLQTSLINRLSISTGSRHHC